MTTHAALLLALLAAGTPGKKKDPPSGKDLLPGGGKTAMPKDCKGQCGYMEEVMKNGCTQRAGGDGPNAATIKSNCGSMSKDVLDACLDSCKEKGRIDEAYLEQRMNKVMDKYQKKYNVPRDENGKPVEMSEEQERAADAAAEKNARHP